MPNVPQNSQQILSCWIKRQDSSKHEIDSSTVLGKITSQQQWNNIFGKPPKQQPPLSAECKIDQNELDECRDSADRQVTVNGEVDKTVLSGPSTLKRKPINPKSPFNSFMVTMKTPRGLEFPCKPSSGVETSPESCDPSYWVCLKLPSSSFSSQDPKSPNNFYETENDTICSSQSQCSSQPTEESIDKRAGSQGSSAVAYFFAKRPSKVRKVTSSGGKYPSLPEKKPIHAPYNILHVRPEADWPHRHVNRRDRSLSGHNDLETYEISKMLGSLPTSTSDLPLMSAQTLIHTPTRRLLNSVQLQKIAIGSISIDSLSQTRSLSETVYQQDAFDQGMFEHRMWCEKYAPKKPAHHISPKSTEALSTWLYTQQARLDKTPTHKAKKAKSKTSLDGFIVDDCDVSDSYLNNNDAIMILSGPTGCGKTSAVYAASHNLDAFVFEINASTKRTGKELTRLLEGISRNHAVHSAKNVVILIDEADLVYENEAGTFWPTIAKFASTSRRPLVVTCNDPSLVPHLSLKFEHIEMEPPSLMSLVDISYLIALKEGHLVDKIRLVDLVTQYGNDLRKVLTNLQYWCQFGLGGLPSGADWVPKFDEVYPSEMLRTNTGNGKPILPTTSGNRVISDGTWFELPVEQLENAKTSDIVSFELDKMPEFADIQDEIIARSEDSVWVNTALPVSQWVQPVRLPAHLQDTEKLTACIFPFRYESPRTRLRALLLDIAPYMRNMVVSDAQRQLVRSSAMSNLSEREQRMLSRSMRDAGIDTRNYLNFTFPAMTRMLNTGFKMASASSPNTSCAPPPHALDRFDDSQC